MVVRARMEGFRHVASAISTGLISEVSGGLSPAQAAQEMAAIGEDLLSLERRMDRAWRLLSPALAARFDPINNRWLDNVGAGARALIAEADKLQAEIDGGEL